MYLFCLFLYFWLTVSNRVSKAIFSDITFKSVGLWGRYGLKQGNPLQFFSKHWSNCICFVYFSIFDLLYQRGYQRQYFWTLHLKVLAYEVATAWNRGIPCKILNFLIQLYLLCSFLYSLTYCIKQVINGKIFWRLNDKSVGLWGSYGLKQGNPLQFFQNTDPIVFVLFISLFLTYCIKEGIKGNIFGHYI